MTSKLMRLQRSVLACGVAAIVAARLGGAGSACVRVEVRGDGSRLAVGDPSSAATMSGWLVVSHA
jgi:hypothetical protein